MTRQTSRQSSISTLHPLIRTSLNELMAMLNRERLNFEVFESWRSPELQAKYFSYGRNAMGKIVDRSKIITYARPWRSFHQYGLAVDLVLKEGRKWSWNDRGINGLKWTRMHELAKTVGLRPLSFEKPHLQPASISTWRELYTGNYPAKGDEIWREKMVEAISKWDGTVPPPPYPETKQNERRYSFNTSKAQMRKKMKPWQKVITYLQRVLSRKRAN